MSGFSFLILFALSCISFPCEGGIISPAKGTEFTFLPGTTGNITWIFDDAISSLFTRAWLFTRRGGSTPERLATIFDNNDPYIRKSSLSGVKIVKPGTLLLKNVNQSHNGVYKFELSASGPAFASDVVVFIATTRATKAPSTKNFGTEKAALEECNCSGTEWYIVVVILVSGIIIGLFLAYIVSCSHRRWFKNRKPERNLEPQTTEADTTYQELDLSKMNTEDNYQSLRVNAANNDVANDNDATYTELNKTRDVENNYQSLT